MGEDVSRQRKRIETYLGRLFGYAFSLTRNREDSRDLVQDCVLRALSAQSVPGDEPAYRAWLFRILRNLWYDQIKRPKLVELGLPAEDQLAEWLASGQMKVREHVEKGVENFPAVLLKLFDGSHIGKLLLQP